MIAWGQRSYTAPFPVGTRTIRIRMNMVRDNAEAYNDAYIDDIALSLVSEGNAATSPYLPVANPSALSSTTGWTVSTGTIAVGTNAPCLFLNCFRDSSAGPVTMYQDITLPSNPIITARDCSWSTP